jgi:hypothetical protein
MQLYPIEKAARLELNKVAWKFPSAKVNGNDFACRAKHKGNEIKKEVTSRVPFNKHQYAYGKIAER